MLVTGLSAVFWMFKGKPDGFLKFGDVSVVVLRRSSYYAGARDELIHLIGNALNASPTGRVVIDLQNVKQFTSGPLGALVVSARDADERGGCLLVTGAVSGFVGKVVSTAVTPKNALSYPTVRAALAAVSKEAVIYYDEKLIRVN